MFHKLRIRKRKQLRGEDLRKNGHNLALFTQQFWNCSSASQMNRELI